MRSSSTRPSSIAAAARPAPPIETSSSVVSSAAAASSATDASARRALPWTLSSVRLKTTFGIAHQTSANAAPSLLVAHRRIRLPRGALDEKDRSAGGLRDTLRGYQGPRLAPCERQPEARLTT